MKIFQVITVSEFGGAQSVVSNIIQNLNTDDEVFILYGGNGEAWQDLKNVHLIKLCEHRKEISYKDLFLAFKLLRLRLKYKPDIVHLHSSKMGAIGRIVFNSKTIVYTVHGFDSIRKAFRKFLVVEKMLKYRAAKIVGVSKYDVDCLHEEGITKNVGLVYNGVVDHMLDNFQLEEEGSSLKKRIEGIKCNFQHIVMCISRISPQKKFDLFLNIARAQPHNAFVWIGNKDSLSNLPTNVFCLGEAHSAYMYLKYADVFILPSNYEGLPISLLEALSFGIPVVASNVGGIGEVLDNSNGFAVENNVESFVEKIEYILQEPVHSQMKTNARQSYLKKFTINKMVEGYTSIFRAIYNKRNRL